MATDQPGKADDSAATRLGRNVGRLRRKIREARPEAEAMARDAMEAARPAAERARNFVLEHQDEIRRAGVAGARIAARRATPPALRPVITALERQQAARSDRTSRGPADEPADARPDPPDAAPPA